MVAAVRCYFLSIVDLLFFRSCLVARLFSTVPESDVAEFRGVLEQHVAASVASSEADRRMHQSHQAASEEERSKASLPFYFLLLPSNLPSTSYCKACRGGRRERGTFSIPLAFFQVSEEYIEARS